MPSGDVKADPQTEDSDEEVATPRVPKRKYQSSKSSSHDLSASNIPSEGVEADPPAICLPKVSRSTLQQYAFRRCRARPSSNMPSWGVETGPTAI